jgi:hypothetical protein
MEHPLLLFLPCSRPLPSTRITNFQSRRKALEQNLQLAQRTVVNKFLIAAAASRCLQNFAHAGNCSDGGHHHVATDFMKQKLALG